MRLHVHALAFLALALLAIPGADAASKKKDATPSKADFTDEEEPVEDFDMGDAPLGEEESEADENSDPDEDLDLAPIEDEGSPLGDLENDPKLKDAPTRGEKTGEGTRDRTGAAEPAPAAGIALEVVGKTPLADNYPARIVATDRDAVVVELPVLLGRSRADFTGKGYWIVAEVLVDGKKSVETRQQVTAASLAEFGPTFMFVKLLAPVPAKTGNVEIKVSRLDTPTAAPKALFSRTVEYKLP